MTFTTTMLAAPVPVGKRPVDSISEYYPVDTTDHTIDVGRYCAYIFPGFMGKGQATGSKPSPGQLNDLRQCVGPNGVITVSANVGWRR
jgi:hypothetical protein